MQIKHANILIGYLVLFSRICFGEQSTKVESPIWVEFFASPAFPTVEVPIAKLSDKYLVTGPAFPKKPDSSLAFNEFMSLGHAFLCIRYSVKSDPKRDCYGFYSSENSFWEHIIGPGIVRNEIHDRPYRFALVTESFSVHITSEQKARLVAEIAGWKGKQYRIGDQNCMNFVNEALAIIGLKTPKLSEFKYLPNYFPSSYMEQVASLNWERIWKDETSKEPLNDTVELTPPPPPPPAPTGLRIISGK